MEGEGSDAYIPGQSIMFDGFGNSRKPNFSFSEGTYVYGACSVLWKNNLYVLGGYMYHAGFGWPKGLFLTRAL